jgi:hypothetical protein
MADVSAFMRLVESCARELEWLLGPEGHHFLVDLAGIQSELTKQLTAIAGEHVAAGLGPMALACKVLSDAQIRSVLTDAHLASMSYSLGMPSTQLTQLVLDMGLIYLDDMAKLQECAMRLIRSMRLR